MVWSQSDIKVEGCGRPVIFPLGNVGVAEQRMGIKLNAVSVPVGGSVSLSH